MGKRKRRLLTQREVSITGEARCIVRRAEMHDARVVTLNGLVLFSTESGDAWLLEPGDQLALCLARDGDVQHYRIIESTTKFIIQWEYEYTISEDTFVVTNAEGRTRMIKGYPTKAIEEEIRNIP